jgi:hypothetical protein
VRRSCAKVTDRSAPGCRIVTFIHLRSLFVQVRICEGEISLFGVNSIIVSYFNRFAFSVKMRRCAKVDPGFKSVISFVVSFNALADPLWSHFYGSCHWFCSRCRCFPGSQFANLLISVCPGVHCANVVRTCNLWHCEGDLLLAF